MPDWSIKIVPSSSGSGAAFQPDIKGYKPGDPLPAQQDDLVTWNNTTNQTHQPWLADATYKPISPAPVRGSSNYLSDPIPPKQSSRPTYDVAAPAGNPPSWTVYYCCKLHPTVVSERGTITATAVPSS
jgi:hypothetical protein